MKNSLNLFDSDSLKDFHKRIFFSMIIFLFVYIIAIYRITDVMLFSSNIEFKEVLQKIGEHHPGSEIDERYNRRSVKQLQTKRVLDKHRSKWKVS